MEVAAGVGLLYCLSRNYNLENFSLADNSGNLNNLTNNYNLGVADYGTIGDRLLHRNVPLTNIYSYEMKHMYRQDLPVQVSSGLRQNNTGGNTWIH